MWDKVKPRLKYAYALSLTALMAYLSWIAYGFNYIFWNHLFSADLLQHFALIVGNLGLMAAIAGTILFLRNLNYRFLEWRLLHININFVPLEYKSLRFIFIPAIFYNFPLFAFIEEYIFRDGLGMWPTVTAWDVVWRSVVFGLIHCVGGVTIRSGLALTLAGLAFSVIYLMSGLGMATLFHFHYNTLAFTFMLIQWIKTKKLPFNE